jgi:hypothetical protein
MLPQVCSGRLGSYHEKVDARNQKSSQRPNDKPFDEVGRERHRSDREPHGEELEASPEESVAPFLVQLPRYAAVGDGADEGEA